MRKIILSIILSILAVALFSVNVSAQSNKPIENCNNWESNPNCYNLGVGYSWCEYEKGSNQILNQIYVCYNGELIGKGNYHEKLQINDKFTGIWRGFLTGNSDEEINNIIYVPDFFVKVLKGNIQFVKGIPPSCSDC